MRICLVYDCHHPETIGGAERWYGDLGRRLVAAGHEVTYVTMRQWERRRAPDRPYRVVAAGPRMSLYTRSGRRRAVPPLVFGLGVLAHLFRHGRQYDVVHTASFPYFPLLAAAALRRFGGYRLVVDWFEVWPRSYWDSYLGGIGGRIGYAVQAMCARIRQRSFCFSRLHAARLREVGARTEAVVLRGLLADLPPPAAPVPAVQRVVFAGRHIAEKRVPAIVPAVARARRDLPGLTAELLGDGPERDRVLRAIEDAGLDGVVRAPGFVSAERLTATLADSLCLVLPSSREGYGLVVVEAAAHGTPTVLVAGEDNAAVEHLVEGENGVIARSAGADDLAAAILEVHSLGLALRESTAAWYGAHRQELSIDSSLPDITAAYSR